MSTSSLSKPESRGRVTGTRLRTPRAAAIAGIIFALLFMASIGLIRLVVPQDPGADTLTWVQQNSRVMGFALSLVPFVGIAFLWFLGVMRDRLGSYEDRFFSTVFFGSGLLFLAMVFVSAALASGILTMSDQSRTGASGFSQNEAIAYGRLVMYTVLNVYAVRMAGVFMLSLGTIWLRTRILPRPLSLVTIVLALILLVVINLSLWIIMLFPLWVLGISSYILIVSLRRDGGDGMRDLAPEAALADETQGSE